MKAGTLINEAIEERLFYAHRYTQIKIREYTQLLKEKESNGISIHQANVYKELLEEFRRREAWERDLYEDFQKIKPFLNKKRLPHNPRESFEY